VRHFSVHNRHHFWVDLSRHWSTAFWIDLTVINSQLSVWNSGIAFFHSNPIGESDAGSFGVRVCVDWEIETIV
jgi:cytochrome c biogenesis factor